MSSLQFAGKDRNAGRYRGRQDSGVWRRATHGSSREVDLDSGPVVGLEPKPHIDAVEPDNSSPSEVMRRHLRTEPDDDAQARRDRAWKSYCDQLSTAWQTSPEAATAVERQRRQFTAEPMRGA